jgi:meiotically up-regulated gene 157 (Mug157) protein
MPHFCVCACEKESKKNILSQVGVLFTSSRQSDDACHYGFYSSRMRMNVAIVTADWLTVAWRAVHLQKKFQLAVVKICVT